MAVLLETHLGLERAGRILYYLRERSCQLRFVSPRRTKLGDFRVKNGQKSITVNNDLNRYRLVLTLIHEMAHLHTYDEYGRRVKPHGKEWQQSFRTLLDLFNIEPLFKEDRDMHSVYLSEYRNPHACSGIVLEKESALRKHDLDAGGIHLADVAENQLFRFKNVTYRKIVVRRTRALCQRADNHKMYTIPQAASVDLL